MPVNQEEADRFVSDLKMFAPRFSSLQEKRTEVLETRDRLEAEMRQLPNISQRLQEIAAKRKMAPLPPDEAKLFRAAQYLAALRLVTKVI